MRTEKNGFVCHLEGTWYGISNKYGVLEHGGIVESESGIQAGYTEREVAKPKYPIPIHGKYEGR